MSHSVLRSVGFARFFRRLKPALKIDSLPGRWPEGQLYPIQPDGESYPSQREDQGYPICESRTAFAYRKAVVRELRVREATC